MKTFLLLILLAAIGWFAYDRYYTKPKASEIKKTQPTEVTPAVQEFKIQKCTTPDGRVIYVDHTKEGQCQKIETETKKLHLTKSTSTSDSSAMSSTH